MSSLVNVAGKTQDFHGRNDDKRISRTNIGIIYLAEHSRPREIVSKASSDTASALEIRYHW